MNKKSKPSRMAGEQNAHFNIRIPVALRARFKEACDARGADKSKVCRQLLEAYCDATDEGIALVAPLAISSKKKKK